MNHPATGPAGPEAARRPPGRYDERRTSRLLVASVVVLCAALLGWLVWAALAAATPDTRSSLVGFRALDDRRVEVRFEMTADSSRAATCTIQALDADGEVVGVTRVAVPPGRHDRREVEAVVATRSRAANAAVAGCRLRAHD